MKTVIVIGHIPSAQGATSNHLETNQVTEFSYFKDFAETYLNDVCDIFVHEDIKGYDTRQKVMAERTKDYDLVLELHYNSFNTKAKGVEALYYYKNQKTKLIAQKFGQLVHEKMDIAVRGNNGAVGLSSGNGYGFVYHMKGWALVLEPFFGDNKQDCEKFDKEKFKQVIIETIHFAETLIK